MVWWLKEVYPTCLFSQYKPQKSATKSWLIGYLEDRGLKYGKDRGQKLRNRVLEINANRVKLYVERNKMSKRVSFKSLPRVSSRP